MEKPSRNSLIKYFLGKSMSTERKLIEIYLSMDIDQEYIYDCLKETWEILEKDEAYFDPLEKERFYISFQDFKLNHSDKIPSEKISRFKLKRLSIYYQVAISVLIGVFALSIYLFVQKQKVGNKNNLISKEKNDSKFPSVLLTLSNGSKIAVSQIKNGDHVLLENGISLIKDDKGQISYQISKTSNISANSYHTISTPAGSEISITLPDGSLAKLNAASQIIYPLKFSKSERRVSVIGEVYFEIVKLENNVGSHHKRVPFFVETDQQEIQVLGTKFNVKAYPDELHQFTSLLEGSVSVRHFKSNFSKILKPGEQAELGEDIQISQANLNSILAWTKGDFLFERRTLESILKEASRWYDVEIVCPVDLGKIKFDGTISKKKTIQSFIDMINEVGDLNIQLEGGRVMVKK